jgi:uncharacterized protein YaeQ
LAYVYFDLAPAVEKRIARDYRFKPDLALEDNGKIRLWVECGKVSIKKLIKISHDFPDSRIYVFREDEKSAKVLTRDFDQKAKGSVNVSFIYFEKEFIRNLSASIMKVNSAVYDKNPDRMEIYLNGSKYISAVNMFVVRRT